jgi:hypothetical protein
LHTANAFTGETLAGEKVAGGGGSVFMDAKFPAELRRPL